MKETLAIRPDAQAFDEIRIVTVPRYKMSEMSGDEWRIAAHVEFYRKGELKVQKSYCDVESAVHMLSATYMEAVEAEAYYAGIDGKCDQEGCSAPPEVFYRRKVEVCQRCGMKQEDHLANDGRCGYRIEVRKFCRKHSKRGDCGRDDSDANYELLRGSVEEPPNEVCRRAKFVTVNLGPEDLEGPGLKEKIDSAVKQHT